MTLSHCRPWLLRKMIHKKKPASNSPRLLEPLELNLLANENERSPVERIVFIFSLEFSP